MHRLPDECARIAFIELSVNAGLELPHIIFVVGPLVEFFGSTFICAASMRVQVPRPSTRGARHPIAIAHALLQGRQLVQTKQRLSIGFIQRLLRFWIRIRIACIEQAGTQVPIPIGWRGHAIFVKSGAISTRNKRLLPLENIITRKPERAIRRSSDINDFDTIDGWRAQSANIGYFQHRGTLRIATDLHLVGQ